MLLLGVVQAQAIGVTPVAGPSFDLLQSEVLTGSLASVTFSGLSAYAADYQHLQIRAVARSTKSDGTDDYMQLAFNGIGGTSYTWHNLNGTGSVVNSGAVTGQASIRVANGSLATNSSTANAFTASVIDILDAYETSKYTTTRALTGRADSLTRIELGSGLFMNTAALTSATLTAVYGYFTQYSRFSLFGVKKAA